MSSGRGRHRLEFLGDLSKKTGFEFLAHCEVDCLGEGADRCMESATYFLRGIPEPWQNWHSLFLCGTHAAAYAERTAIVLPPERSSKAQEARSARLLEELQAGIL